MVNLSLTQQLNKLEKSDIDLTVAGTKDAINMVEAGANEVPEEVMLEAIMFGHEEIKRLSCIPRRNCCKKLVKKKWKCTYMK